LGKHHLPHAPERVHDLARMGGVLLLDGDYRQVVEDAMNRQIHIDNLWEGESQERQKYSFRSLAEISVLHGRTSDNRRRIKGFLLVGQTGDMKNGIVVGERVETGVI